MNMSEAVPRRWLKCCAHMEACRRERFATGEDHESRQIQQYIQKPLEGCLRCPPSAGYPAPGDSDSLTPLFANFSVLFDPLPSSTTTPAFTRPSTSLTNTEAGTQRASESFRGF